MVFKLFHPPNEGRAQNCTKSSWSLWKYLSNDTNIFFDWSMFSVAGTCWRWAVWPFFDFKKLVLGQKVPQNGLKMEKDFYKSCGAYENVYQCHFSSHFINQLACNLTKSPKTTQSVTSKIGLRLTTISKWPIIEKKKQFYIFWGICQSISVQNFKSFHQPLRLQSKKLQKNNSIF